MKNILSIKQKSLTVLVSVLASISLVAISVFAATTIGTNITTGGNLSVTGTSTLTGAVTSAGNIIFGSDDTTTTEARFLELTGNGTNYVGIKAPDAITANVIWTLPSADGTANQMLVTDGSGALSWASGLTTALTDGNIFVGNASNVATSVVMSGDVTIDNSGATTIGADTVALTTDTTGNYVASLTAGNGIAVGTAGEGATPSVALSDLTGDWNQTGAFDISLNNSNSELKILEGGTTPTLFGIFDVDDLTTTDKIYTFPDASGTVALTSSNVASATALAADPTDCAANQFANAIASSGNLTCSALTDTDVPDALTISGGTVDNSVIGGTTAAAGTFTTVTANTSVTIGGGTAITKIVKTTCTNGASAVATLDCADTSVAVSDVIFVTPQAALPAETACSVSGISAGVSYTITCIKQGAAALATSIPANQVFNVLIIK